LGLIELLLPNRAAITNGNRLQKFSDAPEKLAHHFLTLHFLVSVFPTPTFLGAFFDESN
jgi:hypothetical protein